MGAEIAAIELDDVRRPDPAANKAARGGKTLLGARAEVVVLGEKEGWKLGASALSFLPLEDGMDCEVDLSPCDWDMLIDRPDVDPEGRDGGTAEEGEMALRSEIIFCRLVNASPLPSFSTSFFLASSRAASKAVRGGEICACRTRGWDSERVELAETDRGGALVSIG
jgi:hypothetical protein